MALVTKVSPSLDLTTAKNAPQITGLYAGAAIAAFDVCYIASADGLVYPCDATAAAEPAEFHGICPRAAAVGEPVTLFGPGTRMRYGAGMTPGATLYIEVTATDAGGLDTVAQVGDQEGVAMVVTATDIMILRYHDTGYVADMIAELIDT